ncbi:MAG: DNA mismatch repair endonuclease MutL [Thermodesulfobacteriota bacterium]
MSRIRILPEDLANQIAAGEVVERPASVVKEFVENSLDAGASQVTVEVAGGGTRLIRVIDDGRGMDEDDVLLCLERHATSKLRDLADLMAITTLGFRGEAVPSIASVARLTITTRTGDQELGTRAEIRFGQVRKIHEMGCGRGTVMEVRDLFGNVPARRKFLKSSRTELFHVEEALLAAALAHPQVGFAYLVGGKEQFAFPPHDDPARRLAHILKVRADIPLIHIQSCEEVADGAVSVWGWFLPPDEHVSSSRARLRLYVAQRPVRDRLLSHAVTEGMHGFLAQGRRPVGALFIDLPATAVDVNVHPAKQEIRLRDGQQIRALVSGAVRQAMTAHESQIKYAIFGAGQGQKQVPASPAPQVTERVENLRPQALFATPGGPLLPDPPAKVGGGWDQAAAPVAEIVPPVVKEEMPAAAAAAAEPVMEPEPEAPPSPGNEGVAPVLARPRYLGQFASSFLLCESEQGLLLIDQHAAHERLLYERLRRHYLEQRLASQALLFPEMVECSPAEGEALEKNMEEIAALGLVVQFFGGQSWLIKGVPALLSALAPLDIFQGVLASYLAGQGSGQKRLEHLFATMACKAALKAHDPLLPAAAQALIDKMLAADIFSHCPHGRPVARVFSAQEVGRWFKRS